MEEQTDSFSDPFIRSIYITSFMLLSGISWYLGNSLSGDFYYLWWIAPVPILYISLKVTGRQAFLLAFTSYLIGRMSWFGYLVMVMTTFPAIIVTLALSAAFGLLISLTRRVVLKTESWLSIWAFPAFFTAFEFLMIRFSADGSAGSIAYTQSHFLLLIQIASITGLVGITFVLTFIPAAVALMIYFRRKAAKIIPIAMITSLIVLVIGGFGYHRLHAKPGYKGIKAGLVVLDERMHDISLHPNFDREIGKAGYYAEEITNLAGLGAKVVVLPERALNISRQNEKTMMAVLKKTASLNKVYLVIGYTRFEDSLQRNSALVISDVGTILADYDKVHLVPGLEKRFTAGQQPATFNFAHTKAGIAICKDMDFPGYIRKYGKQSVKILFVPAWDFQVDDWYHGRMAILRGVENGFALVRCAREGRLTVSDDLGRIHGEAVASQGQQAELLGLIMPGRTHTLYSRWGDWFGWLNLILALIFIGRVLLPAGKHHSL